MDFQYERKLQVNEWLINARWFYMAAVFLIGIMGNSLLGIFTDESLFYPFIILLSVFGLVNAYLYWYLGRIKKTESSAKLKLFGLSQIGIELALLAAILYLGSDKNMSSVFFFVPIISASLIFGLKGGFVTALISGVLVNASFTLDYLAYLSVDVFSKSSFTVLEFERFRNQTFELIKIITTSNLFVVVGVFSGYSAKLLSFREQELISQAENLDKIREYRENELKQLDKTTKLLVKRDLQLTAINKVLDKKIKEQEQSEKSMLKAFSDLKAERKNAEAERTKINAIVANFVDPIILIDQSSRLSLFNPAARDIFGLKDQDLGKEISGDHNYSLANFKEIFGVDFEFKTSDQIKSDNKDEEALEIKYHGQDLAFKVISAKVTDSENGFLGTMKIFYNLTREKMIDKMKSDFISIAAHQLRTPLAAIKWVIKMVLDGDVGKLNEEQKKFLSKGYLSNERIIALVNDMLNVSRIEEGRFGYSFSDCDFIEVLEQVGESLENRLIEKKIKLDLDLPAKHPIVYMDRQKMTLVLQNLLENAVKYTPEFGRIQVTVKPGNELLQVSIKDNGVGIPMAEQPKLFSKFFRASNVMRMQTEGSGLGLFIVKNIVETHGGDISFQSEEGRGTEFTFTLALK